MVPEILHISKVHQKFGLILIHLVSGTTSGSVRIRGDLYVDGTEFIVDVDKVELGDFNIGIASTVSTNSLLDGAGLGIGATSH